MQRPLTPGQITALLFYVFGQPADGPSPRLNPRSIITLVALGLLKQHPETKEYVATPSGKLRAKQLMRENNPSCRPWLP
jgi:hypothetical protein